MQNVKHVILDAGALHNLKVVSAALVQVATNAHGTSAGRTETWCLLPYKVYF